MNLVGKVVLITGARRVGSDLARRLAERGASLSLTYHTSREPIEATLAAIEADVPGARGLALKADLTKAAQADRAVAATVDHFGRLDVLVNMASTYRLTPFDDLTPADFDEMIATNLAAPYFAAVAAGRVMRNQRPDADSSLKGKIINVGDWASDRPGRDILPYITAKGGLATFTLALAKELAPNITVNLVQPGTILPPEGSSEEEVRTVIDMTPLERIGRPDDLNNLILYLLEGTDFVTGACYRVDGGRFLGLDSQDL